MTIYKPGTPALGDTGQYEVSSRPFFQAGLVAVAAIQVIEFPYVTNWIHIRNNNTGRLTDGPEISFSEKGMSTNNYFTLTSSPSVQNTPDIVLDLKVTKLYYRSSSGNRAFQVVAGLTDIPTGSIVNNWSGSIGVG
jgi:hypothetical protein